MEKIFRMRSVAAPNAALAIELRSDPEEEEDDDDDDDGLEDDPTEGDGFEDEGYSE